MENYVALDEALNFLNGGNADMLSVYEADIRHCLAESKMFEDEFGIVYEGAMDKIKDKINRFVAWLKSIITKLKNFVKKLILKFKTSKIDYYCKAVKKAVAIDGVGRDKFKAPDIPALIELFSKFVELAEKTNDIYDRFGTLAEYEDDINEAQKKYDEYKQEYKNATSKKEEIDLEINGAVIAAEEIENNSKTLTKTMEDSIKKFDDICKAAPSVAKISSEVGGAIAGSEGKRAGDISYTMLLNLATKIVNISTNSVLSAANSLTLIQKTFVKVYNRVVTHKNNDNSIEEKEEDE